MIERRWVVRFDPSGVAVDHPGGQQQSIRFDEVQTVAIETNASGSWGPDVWWVLEGNDKMCTFPFGATGEQAAYSELTSRFPDFDSAAAIRAAGCTDNALFVCWVRKA